ncbi:hypothetical protein Bpfe_028379 [Biomphalaria pfeifferi]|uniref:Uncharacterized protein n=1 Tax=Biomphalaria pfeifferi TaxID=112525 RepID=A0AAD8ATL0_BIOPF|nr:hypothetical protein Bpfe_028379 [Biomphalaria pfeifferi]
MGNVGNSVDKRFECSQSDKASLILIESSWPRVALRSKTNTGPLVDQPLRSTVIYTVNRPAVYPVYWAPQSVVFLYHHCASAQDPHPALANSSN